jgi:hypothetical protein
MNTFKPSTPAAAIIAAAAAAAAAAAEKLGLHQPHHNSSR